MVVLIMTPDLDLRSLALEMDAVGDLLKRLDVEHAFSRGAELKGSADIVREWAWELESKKL